MGYNVGCMIASDTLFDTRWWVFGVKLSDENIADFDLLRDVAVANIFLVSIYGVHIGAAWQMRLCGGDAALCQITLTTCSILRLDGLACMYSRREVIIFNFISWLSFFQQLHYLFWYQDMFTHESETALGL